MLELKSYRGNIFFNFYITFYRTYILPKYYYINVNFTEFYKCNIISISVILLKPQIGTVENLLKKIYNIVRYTSKCIINLLFFLS